MRQAASRSSTCRPGRSAGPRSKSSIRGHDPGRVAAVQPAIAVNFGSSPANSGPRWLGLSRMKSLGRLFWVTVAAVILVGVIPLPELVDGCGLVLELVRRLDQPRVEEVRRPPLAAPPVVLQARP
jgi:hypothetical protein